MSYEVQKAKAIQNCLGGKAKFTKAQFKALGTQLIDQLGVKPQDLSQLWELAEPDPRGEVNKSYVEEMIDMIHLQHDEQLENRFDVVNGLKFVHQALFNDEHTRSASLEDIRKLVLKSFENGHALILEKIEGLAKKGKVDRVELMELIENIEHQQLFGGENLDVTIDQGSVQNLALEDDPTFQEYSEDKEKELYSIIKIKLETASKESERVKSSFTVLGNNPEYCPHFSKLSLWTSQTFTRYL